MSTRSISHSEAQALLDCGASWDFRYGGRLAGSCLAPLIVSPRLREGRAWGRAVAALHESGDRLDGHFLAHQALTDALDEDAEDQREKGVYDQDAHHMMAAHLREVLDHYRMTTSPMRIDRLEHEIEVPIPSRGGRRRSNRYRLLVRFDGERDELRAHILATKQILAIEISAEVRLRCIEGYLATVEVEVETP